MSNMKNLAIELQSIGLDPYSIDLECITDFITDYQERTGHNMTILQAIKELYANQIVATNRLNSHG